MNTTDTGLPAEVWQAARLAAGEDVPDASPAAQALAAQALAAADRDVLDDISEAQAAGYRPSGKRGPRVSDVGGCGRSVWYRESPPDGYVPEPVDNRRATLGTVIHKAAQDAREVRYPWRRYEMTVQIPGLARPGRIDEYDPVLGEVTDDKTAGSGKWTWIGTEGPNAEAWGQVNIYAYALHEMGWPVRTVRIIAINRDTGEEEHFRRPVDLAAGLAALDELLLLATLLELGIVPQRDGVGPGSFPCSWCPARSHCWDIPAAVAAGRSPESWTLLGAEPSDAAIAWAAERVWEAAKTKNAAGKAKDVAEKLLEGVRPGTYGGFEVRRRSRKMPDYKAGHGQVVGLYPLPDGERPAVEAIAEPPQRRDEWIEVKPVRAAEREPGARRSRKR